jgi:NAD(P)-dependent dehydrogenase (short-subunit alcohol dehydrogenase family)
LITGGNSGIGLATAKLFVSEGARVVITGRNKETLAAAASELGPNALAVVADATDVAALEAAVKQGAEKFGRYDVLFANAGIPGQTPVGGNDAGGIRERDPHQSHRRVLQPCRRSRPISMTARRSSSTAR